MSSRRHAVFDPFGTFKTKGYLENATAEKDLEKVKRMEHVAFTLDRYLSNFIRPVTSRDDWLDQIVSIQGLDGAHPVNAMDDEVYVAGAANTPEMLERYRAQAAKKRYRTDP